MLTSLSRVFGGHCEKHRSCVVAGFAMVVLCLGTAAMTEAQPRDGNWTGTTGQGRAYNFTVNNGGTQIQPLTFGFSIGCTGFFEYFAAIPISGNSFSLSGGSCPTFVTTGTFTSATSASGSLTLQASAGPGCTCNGSVTTSWSASTGPVGPSADLGITITDGVTSVVPGLPSTYTITATNSGPATVTSLALNLLLPADFGNRLFTPSAGAFTPATGDWTGLNLAAGQNVTMTISGTEASFATGSMQAMLSVSSTGIADPNSANNISIDFNLLTPQANLTVTKSGPASAFTPSVIGYTTTVANNGPSDATGVMLSDSTTVGLGFVSNAGACVTPFPCNLGTIPASQGRVVVTTFDLPSSYSGPDPIQSTALISALTTDPDSTDNSWTVTTLVNPPGGKFFTVTPCRAVDTRFGDGFALLGGTIRTFVLVNKCGIPPSAKAISLNVTATGGSAAGDLRIYPDGSPLPLVSAINYAEGQTRANNAVAYLGGGAINVKCDQGSGTVDLIVDVNGYFE